MKKNLIVNPLAVVEAVENSDQLISGGPVPGRGLDPLRISADEHPHLHPLFAELMRTGLSNLDPDLDLLDGEIELLLEHGVLVDSDNIPERPLFACMLSDIEAVPVKGEPLLAAPDLEFEPFDLTKFRVWMNDRHLSPHFATAWITDRATGMKWGYWLRPDEAEIVAKLKPATSIENIDDNLLARLYSAGIVVDTPDTPGGFDERIERAKVEFGSRRYAVIEDVIPPSQLKELRSYYARFAEQGFMKLGDDQVPLRFIRHDEPVARMLLDGLAPLMTFITGVCVVPTYCYSAIYVEGATLEPHVDQRDCEFSFSLQLDYSPEIGGRQSPWALYMSTREHTNVDMNVDTPVYLSNGSCVVYKGRELAHYRTPLPAGHRSTSLFFHYIRG